jgi:protein-disulfide isomerase
MKAMRTATFALGALAIGAAGYALGTGVLSTGHLPLSRAMAQDAAAMTPMPDASLTETQQREVEAIIRNYLIANPEIIRDAINELQRKEDEAARVAQTQTITDNAARLFSSPTDVVLGNPEGDVTLVEFFDYNCGYCRRAHADMQALLDNDPNLRVVLKEFPILGEGSVQAAQIAVAILLTAPDKYREFHGILLTEPGQVDGDRALAVAEEMGLDPEALSAKAESDEVKAKIAESHELAQLLELTGTPSYVTERQVVVGAVGFEALQAEIERVRACAGQATC